MTSLLERLAKTFLQTSSIARRETGLLLTDGPTSSRWDEILMACTYDENARADLEFLGPRR